MKRSCCASHHAEADCSCRCWVQLKYACVVCSMGLAFCAIGCASSYRLQVAEQSEYLHDIDKRVATIEVHIETIRSGVFIGALIDTHAHIQRMQAHPPYAPLSANAVYLVAWRSHNMAKQVTPACRKSGADSTLIPSVFKYETLCV